jgi:glycosyltransferase involved in cell wall biosynthesis
MITFIYITCRNEPKLEWFVDSLCNQKDNTPIQLVVVDYALQFDETRKELFSKIVRERLDFIHIPSKPNPVQGKYRLTSKNYFSAGSARNTGICYAKYDYLVFVDDTSVMEEGAFNEIVKCAKEKIIVSFGYKKLWEMVVENGKRLSSRSEQSGVDSRWNQGDQFRRIGGSQLFGYSASPLSVILKVNGYDEICNTMGGEDYHYGVRVEKLNIPIYYNANVIFYESEDLADQGDVFTRRDPLLNKEQYETLMTKYNITKRWVPDGRYDLSHLTLDMLIRNKFWTEGNDFNLAELRTKIQQGGEFETKFDPDMKTIEGLYYRDL